MQLTSLASLPTVGWGAAFATGTDEIRLSSGGQTAIILDNGACVADVEEPREGGAITRPQDGIVSVGGAVGGWFISNLACRTSSGSTPLLDLSSFSATCDAFSLNMWAGNIQ
jgi:hypothetical protein